MNAPLLDYQSPISRPKIDWGRRYRRFAPVFALAYVPFLFAYVAISFKLEEDRVHVDPLYYRVLEQVICFPSVSLLMLTHLQGCGLLILGGAISAILWGVSAVGLWHLGHVVNEHIRRRI